MTHLDTELSQLKNEIIRMWDLVGAQLERARQALFSFDKELALQVIDREKYVNALELKIDRDCENIFALFNPVAVDLRFVLAVLKINNNLERNGDIAEGIGKFIINASSPFDEKLIEATKVAEMFDRALEIQQDTLNAFKNEDTSQAWGVFRKDEFLDEINIKANARISEYLKLYPDNVDQGLYIVSTIRKLERIGDQCKNISEEIIFYIEAKVLKHDKKLKKSR